jgi:hypothetical protein
MAKGKATKTVTVESIVAAVKGLGAMRREDEFLKACSKNALTINVSNELIALLKAHLEPAPALTLAAGTKPPAAKKASAKRAFSSIDALELAARVRECDDAENC